MEIYIRAAEMDDVPALKELIPLSARELSKGFYTPQQTESAIQYIFGVDTQLIADKTYYIAEMELGATLPGEPLYAALGYEVTDRFEIPMADGTTLPAAHMKKGLALNG